MSKAPRQPPPPDPGLFDGGEGLMRREGGDRGLSLSERAGARLQRTLYKTPLHRLRLRGRYPLRLTGVPADPIPGDAHIGERIIAGRLIHAGHTAMTRAIAFDDVSHPAAWRDWTDSWAWLRDLAAHQPDRALAAKVAEPLAAQWLELHTEFEATAWRADVTGRRILFATAYAPLILSSADHVYRSAVLNALARWARHLDRAAFRLPDGLPKAAALSGLYAAGLLISGGESRAAAALAGLDKLLDVLVLPDGGLASRTPLDGLELAELLLFTAAAGPAVGERPAAVLTDTLARLAPHMRGLAMGDGSVGAWQGGAPLAKERLERVLKLAAPGNVLARGGRWSGYHRLAVAKTVAVIDAGPPPVARVTAGGHAGTLAFELSDGPDRIIVNCGGARGLASPLPPALAAGLRTTAAHSTLVIADTNSTNIGAAGALGKGVEEVAVKRQESEDGLWLEARHDGYVRRFGVSVERRLFVAASGTDVRGEDVIAPEGRGGLWRRGDKAAFDIRFHLGAGVEATPTADGQGALLKLPQGRVWGFKTSGAPVAIEPSLWIDAGGTVHRTVQLVVSGRAEKARASVAWSFKRAGK